MKVIPITQRYNSNLPSIGSVEPTDRGLIVTLTNGLTRDEIFQIFGCAAMEIHEVESASESDIDAGIFRFKKFRIYEFTRPASYEPLNSLDEAVQKARIEGRADAFDELSRIHDSHRLPRNHFAERRIRELAKLETPVPVVRPIRPTPIPTDGKLLNPIPPFPLADRFIGGFIFFAVAFLIALCFLPALVELFH